ncbi:aminoglycoside phosphotransferase family protein [Actinoplanes sp. NBRC 103695]|uniref:phosphotransferase n=1 Tax=Actinoplanes sp. NBRC 103695 TaxID=3032202 RepID=UPI0024A427B4|nr:aminoglycoside phosphotransferase family protein [Actinoplanes sp. NBRC 103695]GLY99819.1 aminoglycoside phosphotransferase [Actinoplanes sp. NBRC 103695]
MGAARGRFGEMAMRESLARIVDRYALNASDATLLRLTNNAVFALPNAGLVVRITRSHTLHARVHKNVALAAWFAAINAPTIRLAAGLGQPIADGDLRATIWDLVPPSTPTPDATDLGTVLRRFHALGLPAFDLPAWDPIADARARIIDAEALGDGDRDYLLHWCDRLEPRLAAFAAANARSLMHGDAHPGNLLRRAGGPVLLCDFDATAAGPWQVDLVPAPASEGRFGAGGAHAKLAAAYGYDITTDPAWPLLREARELKMIVGGVPLLASGPGIADEFAVRLNSVRNGDSSARWTAFGDLPR